MPDPAPSPAPEFVRYVVGVDASDGNETCVLNGVREDGTMVVISQMVTVFRDGDAAPSPATGESALMATREREEILKNDEIALAIADGMARCADVFLHAVSPPSSVAAARMTHERLFKARTELAALRAENARMREALEKIASETAATWVCDAARAALGGRDEGS